MAMFRKCGHCGSKVTIGQQCNCEREYKRKYAKQYDKNVRNNSENIKFTKFYRSISWIKKSKYIKLKYHNLCLICLLEYKKIVACDVVHHIETLRDNWEKRLDDDNLIPLCHDCHNVIDHSNYTEDEKNKLRDSLKKYMKIYTN